MTEKSPDKGWKEIMMGNSKEICELKEKNTELLKMINVVLNFTAHDLPRILFGIVCTKHSEKDGKIFLDKKFSDRVAKEHGRQISEGLREAVAHYLSECAKEIDVLSGESNE